MKKEDAPRLKKFLGSLMRSSMGTMPVRDMVQFVDDMKWLAEFAEHLDKPQEGMKVISTSPIRNDITPKKKAKKK